MSQTPDFSVRDAPLDGLNLIEASAGTGKTWNICGLYLRLLIERGLTVDQILVVTFTTAAAAELRDRIRTRLADCLKMAEGAYGPHPTDDLLADLIARFQAFGCTPDDLIQKLEMALQGFDEAAIFTIHGFCQRALSDAAFQAGQALELTLLTDDESLLRDVVNDFWRTHIATHHFPKAFAAYLLQKKLSTDVCLKWLRRCMARPLAQRKPARPPGGPTMDDSKLHAAFETACGLWTQSRDDILLELARAGTALNQTSYRPKQLEAIYDLWDQHALQRDAYALLDVTCNSYKLSEAILADKTRQGQKDKQPRHPFFCAVQNCLEAAQALQSILNEAWFGLIHDFLDWAIPEVRQRKQRQQVLGYDDMLLNLYQALHQEPDHGIAATLRHRFPVALIDEFQDTDPLQWACFERIYAQSDAPVFLVGDPKQAIYSFRNADLFAYLSVRDKLSARDQVNRIYTLRHNQRSSPGIIRALNALFGLHDQAFILPGLDYPAALTGQRAHPELIDPQGPPTALNLWMLPLDDTLLPLGKDKAKALVTRATASEISRLLVGGANGAIKIGERPLQPSDICILVRTHREATAQRKALSALGIASVELARESVFQTDDAEALEYVLRAAQGTNITQTLHSALASVMLGYSAADLVALQADEAAHSAMADRFADYHEHWIKHGIVAMLRRLITDMHVAQRLLRRDDGKRRLTNLRHLTELLHQAQTAHPTPESLLRWFEQQRRHSDTEQDARQLRLESDQNLVKIITIHKAKGLEFGVVFCPFLWNNGKRHTASLEPLEYHDDANVAIIDFGEANDDRIKEQVDHEARAETQRLNYVALTRAVQRLYVVVGSYLNGGRKANAIESLRSPLNWLVTGKTQLTDSFSTQELSGRWASLANAHASDIGLQAIPELAGASIPIQGHAPNLLRVPSPPGPVQPNWHTSSFSGLSSGANKSTETFVADHDLNLIVPRSPLAEVPSHIPLDDILRFPRGASEGTCLHAVFEGIDFTQATSWPQTVTQALSLLGTSGQDPKQDQQRQNMVLNLLRDVMCTPMTSGFCLRDISMKQRLTEIAFQLPASRLTSEAVNAILQEHEPEIIVPGFRDLSGYLKGVIDLVFEHKGLYYVLDWKSNHLGYDPADYAPNALHNEMRRHNYHFQALLYSLALNRHLQTRLPAYHYQTHFGGVIYLFIRGVRPNWRNPDGSQTGVYTYSPKRQTLEKMSALFTSWRSTP